MASGGDIAAEIDANLVEKHQVADVNQGHVSAYAATPAQMWSLTTHAGVPLQTLQHTTYGSTENGYHSSSGYCYDQPSETTKPREAPNKANTTSHPPAGVGAHGTQDYLAYTSYPYSSASYGYSNTEYSNQYYGYQQPANASSQQYQQLANAPSQHYQQILNDSSHQYQQPANAVSQQYQQPTNAASQQYQQPANASTNQYQQPGNTPSQQYHQPETQQYQQPASAPSHLQVGAGPTTGAPYQPLSSFQNASSFEGPTSYSGTYYNHGDYQTSGFQSTGYQNSGFSNQTNNWSDNSGGSYPTYDYSSYSQPSSSSTHNTNNATGNPQYQQQYNQWSGYYGQTTSTNPLCAPGTETTPSTGHSTVENAKQIPHGGYHYANNQPPPPGTTAWRQEFASSGVSKSQQGKDDHVGYNQTNNWSSQEHDFSNGDKTTPYLQNTLSSSQFSHANADRQPTTIHSHSSNLQFPLTNQISQNFQTHSHTTSTQDPCQTSKIQIPTNPRIAANVVINTPKINNNTVSVTSASAMKPAYISVGPPNLHNKAAARGSSENAVMGTLPPSLRSYVEKVFSRCKDDSQRAANQKIMKEMITQASADGTLLTRNWDMEPLFPLPKLELDAGDNNVQNSSSVPTLTKPRRSPSRRTKSRWEPLPEEKLAEKLQFVDHKSTKNVAWNSIGNKKAAPLMQADGANYVRKENGWNKMKFVPAQQQPLSTNTMTRPLKKQKNTDSSITENGDASSDSDKEQNLTKYYSSAITLASTPEERKKRENRSKRFEKGQERSSESKSFKTKSAGAGNLYTRRTNALFLAKKHDDITNRAVEDIDWDSLTVKGACQEIEKRYLRLTSAPDPATVRPEEVLERALLMVQSSQKNYLYKCDQLKSIRQDLTVQRIRNELTVKVYETHARLAIEAGDMAEYNQCQSQLKNLYSDGILGCHLEFSAYSLLCVILHSTNNRELLSSMARLSSKAREDEAVKHALAVRSAVTSGNYILFFRLYKKAPNLNTCFMDLYVEKMRFEAVKCMCKSYRPSVPVAYVAQVLGFSKVFLPEDNKETERLEGCDEWLRAHGAVLIASGTGEMQLDTKASSSTLFMPEPEDAVSHGDATLAVDDFFTRTS